LIGEETSINLSKFDSARNRGSARNWRQRSVIRRSYWKQKKVDGINVFRKLAHFAAETAQFTTKGEE